MYMTKLISYDDHVTSLKTLTALAILQALSHATSFETSQYTFKTMRDKRMRRK